MDEGQGVDNSNLDTDNLVDCSEYVQTDEPSQVRSITDVKKWL